VSSGAVTVGRQKLFHQHVLNSSPLKMQINSGSHGTQICSALSVASTPLLALHAVSTSMHAS
jgi:hypothetical protein